MRTIVIGASGHIGTYLIPMLAARGHDVVAVSRGASKPYRDDPAWAKAETVALDRTEAEKRGSFGPAIAALRPDVVVDLICFDRASAEHIATALRGRVEHYIFCSSIWVYGKLAAVPSAETEMPGPIDAYGSGKAAAEAWLCREARLSGFPATSFRPGHIVGEGWSPINPLGNVNPDVFSAIARGDELVLPNLGLEMVHHVHARDLAHWILCAIDNRAATIGEAFNAVSAQALTLKAFAEAMFRWFGHEPRLAFKPYEDWLKTLSKGDAEASHGHVIRSSCHSIEKSRRLLGYAPAYASLEAVQESVRALIAAGKVQGRPAGWPGAGAERPWLKSARA